MMSLKKSVARKPSVAVVVAHPDDEILWLSSAVADADRIIFCFGAPFGNPRSAEARRKAVAALPLANLVDLAVPESGAGFSIDWTRALLTASGIAITDPEARARYEANYLRLVETLRELLAGVRDVYTHNPWGEYGHAEHIQVYRAVVALQAEVGYTIWFSNYVGASNWGLARTLGAGPHWVRRCEVQPDLDLVRKLRRVYQDHGAWTWYRTHRWPARETFYAQALPGSSKVQHPLSGEWLLDVAGLRWWPPSWRPANRRLD